MVSVSSGHQEHQLHGLPVESSLESRLPFQPSVTCSTGKAKEGKSGLELKVLYR